jgi:two-component system cell cycle response regulator
MTPFQNSPQLKTRVLLVEDSPTQAAELQYLLESEAFAVTVARDGNEALESLAGTLPALVISDVLMPGLDGYELCRRMKADARLRQIPVVLLTTLSEPDDIFKGLDCSADHYAIKPYEGPALISRLQAILADRYLRETSKSRMGLEISYCGRKYFINADRIQILDLLLATFENIVRKNRELEELNMRLKETLESNHVLQGLLPICSFCKKVRDDKGYWSQVDAYLTKHTDALLSHGICPDCMQQHYPQFAEELNQKLLPPTDRAGET